MEATVLAAMMVTATTVGMTGMGVTMVMTATAMVMDMVAATAKVTVMAIGTVAMIDLAQSTPVRC